MISVNQMSGVNPAFGAFWSKKKEDVLASSPIKSSSDEGKLEASLDCLAQCGKASVVSPHVKPKKMPYSVDLAFWRMYSNEDTLEARKIISSYANCYRFGNRDSKCLTPDVKNNVIDGLKELGINDVDENDIKVVMEGDTDNLGMRANRIPIYFNDKTQKSIVFTKDGVPNYQLSFETNKKGKIIDMTITDIYDSKKHIWYEK